MWTKEYILSILMKANSRVNKDLSHNRVIYRMLLALYAEQTSSEKEYGKTWSKNKVGFNAYDAPYLSKVVKESRAIARIPSHRLRTTAFMLRKYAGQLEVIAKKKVFHPEQLRLF
jgi:hypothetical protein